MIAEEVILMTPVRLWIGFVLVVLGLFGVLDATGVVESSELIEDWWPLALAGLGAIIAFDERRISFGSGLLMLVGVGLLVERQNWVREELVWPLVLVAVGVTVLLSRHRKDSRPGQQVPAPQSPAEIKTP
jgi:sugar phosphate permease